MKKIVIFFLTIHFQGAFANTSPREAKINSTGLAKLIQRSEVTKSDELIIIQNGRTIFKKNSSAAGHSLMSAQSISKTITALTYILLMRDGLVDSLDLPLSQFYPALAMDSRKSLTVRSLLTHSSGLIDPANLWDSPNLMDTILKLQPAFPVYTQFSYSNAGAELMGDIIDHLVPTPTPLTSKVVVDPVISYLNSKILKQLGISDLQWSRDAQGHLQTSGGIFISADSLAKIGLLFQQNGKWNGKQIIEPDWLSIVSDPKVGVTACYALMTWIISPTCGQRAGSAENLQPDKSKKNGFYMDGYGGQYVVIIPERKIVAIRMKTPVESTELKMVEDASFFDFPELVSKL